MITYFATIFEDSMQQFGVLVSGRGKLVDTMIENYRAKIILF